MCGLFFKAKIRESLDAAFDFERIEGIKQRGELWDVLHKLQDDSQASTHRGRAGVGRPDSLVRWGLGVSSQISKYNLRFTNLSPKEP